MDAIEKRARELFADQLRKECQFEYAHHVAVGGDVDPDGAALRAIIAALTPPEGYVLVPVEPTEEMIAAAEDAHMPFGDMGIAISAANGAGPEVQGV